MGRPRSQPSLYWLSRERTWCVNIGGRRHRLGPDKSEADARRIQLLASATPKDKHGLTVAEALTVYLKSVTERLDPRTLHRIATAIDAVVETLGDKLAREFGPLSMARVRDALLERTFFRRGVEIPLSRRYVTHLVKSIQTGWTWLVSQELVPPGSDQALRSLRPLRRGDGRETKRVLPADPDVVECTLPWLTPPVRAMVQVQRLTGMRPGEVCRMRRSLISTTPGEVLTPPNSAPVRAVAIDGAVVWLYAPELFKTLAIGKPRVIPIGPRAQDVLLPLLERAPDKPLFSPRECAERVRWDVRDEYDSASYCRSVSQSLERANRILTRWNLTPLPSWSPLQLRHWAATLCDDESGRDTTAALLGHNNPNTSAIYAERAIRRAAAHVARFG